MADNKLLERIASGEKIQRGEQLPAPYRSELLRLMTVFVDSQLAGAAGFAEIINQGPGLKERRTAASIVADRFDRAEQMLDLMRDFGINSRLYVTSHPWAARLDRAIDLDNRRVGGDKRLNVFHYPIEGWIDGLILNTLMGIASAIQLSDLRNTSYAPLATIMQSIVESERSHADMGEIGLNYALRFNSKAKAQVAVDYWYPRVLATFGRGDSEHSQKLIEYRLLEGNCCQRTQRWQQEIKQLLQRSGLTQPEL